MNNRKQVVSLGALILLVCILIIVNVAGCLPAGTPSVTPTPTVTVTPSLTSTPQGEPATHVPTNTLTPFPTHTWTATSTPSSTRTNTATSSPTATGTQSPSSTPTIPPIPVLGMGATEIEELTRTPTPLPTITPPPPPETPVAKPTYDPYTPLPFTDCRQYSFKYTIGLGWEVTWLCKGLATDGDLTSPNPFPSD
jgi:hypothetical protein